MTAADADHGSRLSDVDVRVRALESLLIESGYLEAEALDRLVEAHETVIGPHIGAVLSRTSPTGTPTSSS